MSSLNRVTLIGRIGRDPEIKTMNNSDRVVNFSVATTEKWRDKSGQQQERTEWHRVVVFGEGLISVIEKYSGKGQLVMVEGSLRTREWTDQNQQKRYTTEIVLSGFNSKFLMLGGGRGDSGGSSASYGSAGGGGDSFAQPSYNEQEFQQDPDDSIPF